VQAERQDINISAPPAEVYQELASATTTGKIWHLVEIVQVRGSLFFSEGEHIEF
jgi:hypothetical protein